MSSVLRFLKQTPSKTIFNQGGAQLFLYTSIQTAVDANSGSFLSDSMVLFPTLSNLTTALTTINSGSSDTSNDTALLDMGSRVFMGLEGGDSELVVLGLVKVIQGTNADAALVGYVCLQDETSTIDEVVGRGAW